jgi:hypothetical protein
VAERELLHERPTSGSSLKFHGKPLLVQILTRRWIATCLKFRGCALAYRKRVRELREEELHRFLMFHEAERVR